MLSIKEYRELIISLQDISAVDDHLDRLGLTKDELDLLYVFADSYRNDIWGHGMCYLTDETMPIAQRTAEVARIIYDYKEVFPFSEKQFENWSYPEYAMLYKYTSDQYAGKTIGEAGREIASKYGFNSQWVKNFSKRVSLYSTPKKRLKAPYKIIAVYRRLHFEKAPITKELKDEFAMVWEKHKRSHTV
jgi:hypothetical protein